ncbi:phospholipase A [Chitinimonas taiwanensis]|uniref:Phospholipase A1 n=1 Tax=Chitinimonas taiwanensis DSM 18899 TaxID=1121279 RepID=A0A1K2HP30_9NEIS|nr:phospholipase A [Chitinimonas taiwanensis]SFZ78526.1 phospholipase A1 [Chitinimonas taiwanensis DSM 18899]
MGLGRLPSWAWGALLLAAPAQAAPLGPTQCLEIAEDSTRLRCYDQAMGRALPAEPAVSEAAVPAPVPKPDMASQLSARPSDTPAKQSLLDSAWELEPSSKLGTFVLRSYRPTYVLPFFHTAQPNGSPSSRDNAPLPTAISQQQRTEAKFQLSLKTKLAQNLFEDNGDIWLGFTQTSRWQVYNRDSSRPFRETNYEPEAALVLRSNYHVLGWHGRLLSLGLNHQSNGQSQQLSRSWNRVTAGVGLEKDGWSVLLRPWWRVRESARDDDNPDIENYLGRGSLTISKLHDAQWFSLMARHSLRTGAESRGALQFDWGFPIKGNLKGYLQLFHGYGESLVDYNHRATYLGLGFSLIDGN